MSHHRFPIGLMMIAVLVMLGGCKKVDLRTSFLRASRCPSVAYPVTYAFKIENRDFTRNILVRPGDLGRRFAVQASACREDGSDCAPAGGWTASLDKFGPDQVLSPGESTDCIVVGSGQLGTDPFPSGGYLMLRVDSKDEISEYNEENNTTTVPLEDCPSFPVGPGVNSCVP